MLDATRPYAGPSRAIGTVTLPRSKTPALTLPIAENPAGALAKRVLDIVGATVGLALLSPVLALVAVAVRLDSPGSAVFRQQRIGRGGRPFTFYKFRTMRDGNDPAIHRAYTAALIKGETENLRGENGSFKIEADPRVTRLGRFLRRTSIDELPQLVNVLRGDMSLVGPRPPLDYEVALYSDRDHRRLGVTPGITGLWQVNGRCGTTFSEMVDLDLAYIDNWSLGLDLRIIARTFRAVLDRKGAW